MKKETILNLSLLFLTLSFLTLLIPAFFSRWMADDYCFSGRAITDPFFIYLKSTMENWTGKFSFVGFTWLFASLPPQFFGFLAFAVGLLWILALFLCLYQASKLFKLQIKWQILLILSFFVLSIFFLAAPNLFQTLYWFTGLLVYSFPLLFFTFNIGFALYLLQKKRFNPAWLFLLALFSFIACGFGETPMLAQLTILGGIVLGVIVFKPNINRKRCFWIFSSMILGGLIAFVVQYTAGGTGVRQSLLLERLPFWDLLKLTSRNVVFLYGKLLLHKAHWVLLAFLSSFLMAYFLIDLQLIKINGKRYFWILIASIALVNILIGFAVCGAVAWFMRGFPDDRIIYVPYYFAFISITAIGILSGAYCQNTKLLSKEKWLFHKKLSPIYTFICVLILSIFCTTIFFIHLPHQIDYAQRWDSREQLILQELAAGKKDLIIPGMEARFLLPDLQLESGDWVNSCFAIYYGANSITGK